MIVAACLGFLGALALGRKGRRIAIDSLPSCTGYVVLFTPCDASSRALDRATGGYGYSHAALDLCARGEDGSRWLVDCTILRGVHLAPWANYAGRRMAMIPLELHETAEARGAARALMGKPWGYAPGGWTCADFVYECLPSAFDSLDVPRPVTANNLARALGVPRAA